jgi:hypothetical protein
MATDGHGMLAVERARVTIVAGGLLGLVVGGIGSRLGMLALRLTSPDYVRGIESDDGFTIGQVTLSGTLILLSLCTAVGVIGAFAYRLVAPALIGPPWLHRATVALGAGAVVGAMVIHPDGVDFTLLEPAWLAIAVFVAIPLAFGAGIGPTLDRCDRPDAWVNRGRWLPWLLAVGVLALSFVILPAVVVAGAVMVVWAAIGGIGVVRRLRSSTVLINVLRVGWIAVAGLGLAILVEDVAAIT